MSRDPYPVDALRPSTALGKACTHLLQMIDLGLVMPGQRLPPADAIAEMVGVSRPIVLQALRALEDMGRVEVRRGSGAWVLPLSADNVDARRAQVWRNRSEILQMSAVREMLEVGVIRRLATVGLAAERVEQAETLIERMREHSGDLDACRPIDTAFHELLVAGLGMPIVEDLLRSTRARAAAAFEFLDWPADRAETSIEEHRILLRAIVDRDPDRAAQLAADHIGVSTRLIEDLLGGEGAALLSAPRSAIVT